MKIPTETTKMAQMGMAALLPGMQFMIERMQAELDEMRRALGILQAGEVPKKVGRPRKVATGASGWSDDPEERSREMKRRYEVRDKKRAAQGNPRDKDHPNHAEWVAKTAKAHKRFWKNMTPAQRKARLAAMAAGQKRNAKAKAKPRVKAQANSNLEKAA
jgi:hypothetical protein